MLHWSHMPWWHMAWMGFFWLILAGLALAVVFRLAGSPSRMRRESPERLLKQRYARGEISREEYIGKLQDLRR
jgi:uncharacterized membrane protein